MSGEGRATTTVVKVGGGLLELPGVFDLVTQTLGRVGGGGAGAHALVVVPGGGPFADAVREVDHHLSLPPSAAHWMAALAMDQYAHALAARIAGASLVTTPEEVRAALAEGRTPVLAPYRWLREADPLPHSWEVTSDSIAAWLTGQLGARRLVLVKPVGGDASPLVDRYFAQALPERVECHVLAAGEIARLESLLAPEGGAGGPAGE